MCTRVVPSEFLGFVGPFSMAPLTQVFVRALDGRTRCLNFERDDASHEDALTLRHLRRALESSEGVPASEQLIRVGGLVLGDGDDDRALRSLSDAPAIDVDLLLRINGGKGGFGSLLRGSKSAQTTTNFDACRDLSGRRMRHVNAEKKMIEWAKHAEERELEKIALKHINSRSSQIKRKFDEIEEQEKERFKVETLAQRESTEEAVAVGIRIEAQRRAAEAAAKAERKREQARKQRALDGMYGMGGISDSDSDDDEPTMPNADDAPKMDPSPEKSNPPEPERPETPREDAEAQKEEGAGSPDTGDAAPVLPAEIVLKDHGSAEELEAFGLDRLKEELMKNGLKCGGTLAERAQRLFLLRDKTIDEIDAKYKPPVRKEKRR